MTWADRLIGPAFLLPAVVAATVHGYVKRARRLRRWPWALAIGLAVLGLGLLIPFLPIALVAPLVMGVDVWESHAERQSSVPRGTTPRGRHRE